LSRIEETKYVYPLSTLAENTHKLTFGY